MHTVVCIEQFRNWLCGEEWTVISFDIHNIEVDLLIVQRGFLCRVCPDSLACIIIIVQLCIIMYNYCAITI